MIAEVTISIYAEEELPALRFSGPIEAYEWCTAEEGGRTWRVLKFVPSTTTDKGETE